MRVKVATVLLVLILSSTLSTANPGGEGDGIRSRDCAGSCHADSSSNGASTANITIQFQEHVYTGLLTEVTVTISDTETAYTSLIGVTLLINTNGAKDLPAYDGWEIVADHNGGTNNYVESTASSGNMEVSWTLRAPSTGTLTLYAAVQHGSPTGNIAMTGISSPFTIDVEPVPENLPRLETNWEPPATRELGEETTIILETTDVNSYLVEMRIGTQITPLEVTDDEFTIPAASKAGVVEWRAILSGEGPDQTTPWFRLIAEEPSWGVDETSLYMQGFAVLLLFAGMVLILPKSRKEETMKEYEQTSIVREMIDLSTPVASTGPPLPAGGLPPGWTMEQWEYYGHEYVDPNKGGLL
ncbi:MAG: hypothetical protein QGI21_06985 [Candidatus Poseidoniaceae archaeon]|jgi:hypothetical protein|nr:hypothetical protein [Candidatus Poseidoniaceae archaeon]